MLHADFDCFKKSQVLAKKCNWSKHRRDWKNCKVTGRHPLSCLHRDFQFGSVADRGICTRADGDKAGNWCWIGQSGCVIHAQFLLG